jgi:2-amino-4-hydroxy-6-hydroxymethyldihydropteridine diphosphokinase
VRAWIGAGSNLGDRWGHLAFAAARLRASGVAIVRASGVWDTAPVGPPQPRFLNAAMELETRLGPRPLLELLLRIEREAHRRRIVRWGPRTLDLDLLLWEDRVIAEPGLVLPHPGMVERRFVLAPLAEIAPELPVPGTGHTVSRLLEASPPDDLRRVGLYPI